MLDFHAHILPGADHGSDGLETSLRQLELAEKAGIDTIVATPHFYPQAYDFEHFLHRRRRTYEILTEAYHGPIQIIVGAEVRICVGLENLEGLEKLCVANTNVMLLELPFGREITRDTIQTACLLEERTGLRPVLAHVDRYPPAVIEELFENGLCGQVNAEAMAAMFGTGRYKRWIDQGLIVAYGSDIHGTEVGYSQYLKGLHHMGKARAEEIENRVRALIF